MSRTRLNKFFRTLLEKGEWNQVEAEELIQFTTPKNDKWIKERFCCIVCGDPLTKGIINYQYMLKNNIWEEAGFTPRNLAHISCAESKLGRELVQDDFTDAPMNGLIHWLFQQGIPIPKN